VILSFEFRFEFQVGFTDAAIRLTRNCFKPVLAGEQQVMLAGRAPSMVMPVFC
jgi:hypothetical protein